MKKYLNKHSTIIFLLGFVIITNIAVLVYLLFSSNVSELNAPALSLVNSFILLVAVIIAYLSLSYNKTRNYSTDYLSKSISLLEKAYDLFSVVDEQGFPKNDRLLWLTTARLIKTSIDTSNLITEDSHKRIYNIELAYWRYQFSKLLYVGDHFHTFPEEYYAEKPIDHYYQVGGNRRAPIARTSLAFMYRFVKWPEGELDTLENVKPFDIDEINQMIKFGPEELGRHLLSVTTAIEDERKARGV